MLAEQTTDLQSTREEEAVLLEQLQEDQDQVEYRLTPTVVEVILLLELPDQAEPELPVQKARQRDQAQDRLRDLQERLPEVLDLLTKKAAALLEVAEAVDSDHHPDLQVAADQALDLQEAEEVDNKY